VTKTFEAEIERAAHLSEPPKFQKEFYERFQAIEFRLRRARPIPAMPKISVADIGSGTTDPSDAGAAPSGMAPMAGLVRKPDAP
jgi:hypothetical protein